MPDHPARPLGVFAAPVLWRLFAVVVPAVGLTALVVLALYGQDRANEWALLEQAAEHVVDVHADVIERELQSVESDLRYLADQAVLRDFLSGGVGQGGLEEEYVLFCRHRGVYDQIRYLDATGQEVIRVNDNGGRPAAVPAAGLQSKAGRYYFAQSMLLDRGEVFVSPFDLNVEHDVIEQPPKPVIRFATPVFDGRGVKRGVLVLNYLGAVLLRKLGELSVTFPGRTWLLNRAGYFLRGPSPDDEWAFMYGKDRTLAGYYPDAWAVMSGADHGHTQSAQGLFTFRALRARTPIPVTRRAPPAPSGRPDPDAGDAGLRVVAFVPAAVVDARAGHLLGRMLLFSGAAAGLITVLGWYLAYVGALRRQQARHIAESEARLRTLSARLMTAQEDERRSISRDLHDEMGQLVTSVSLDLQRAAQAEPAKKDELIARALRGTECLLERIHEVSARLRPTLLDDLGLKDAVQSLLGDFEHHTGVVPRADLRLDGAELPAVVSENVYRILQEALTNVSKHAQAAEVFVELRAAAGWVELAVRDEGAGFRPEALDGKRLGILGMRERAELLDGTFELTSEPGKGTRVRVTLPLS